MLSEIFFFCNTKVFKSGPISHYKKKKKKSQWNDPTGQRMSWHKDEKTLVAAVQENIQTQSWSL